ncbi:MAG TPA: hypothetical protein VMI52_14475 [Acetobacteraceae bacterium]|nr:hypothetical protein [Acetobacteraceae bacterium]
MRAYVVFGVTVLALSLSAQAPVRAQAQALPDTAFGARPGNQIGTGQSLPVSNRASNITGGGAIAPRLPTPAGDGDVQSLLVSARQALLAGRTGEAQEALERAETRILDRSVPIGDQNIPAGGSLVEAVTAARQALGAGDTQRAVKIIDGALPQAATVGAPN